MKRLIRRTIQMITAFCVATALISCSDADEEIFKNADIQMEQETDETDDKKAKPGQVVSENLLFYSPSIKTYQTPSLS